MRRSFLTFVLGSAISISMSAVAKPPPPAWDGLTLVKSDRFDLVYLRQDADFRSYSKVLIDPVEVAFHKDWKKDYNSGASSLGSRISDGDLQDAISKGVVAAGDVFDAAFKRGGYEVVGAPGPDVLRVKTGIVHIRVSAPDQRTAARSYNFAGEAGSATLFVEARDSTTGELLGRAVDQKIAGDNSAAWRTSVSNRADFRKMVENWATAAVRGVGELKVLSPIRP